MDASMLSLVAIDADNVCSSMTYFISDFALINEMLKCFHLVLSTIPVQVDFFGTHCV